MNGNGESERESRFVVLTEKNARQSDLEEVVAGFPDGNGLVAFSHESTMSSTRLMLLIGS